MLHDATLRQVILVKWLVQDVSHGCRKARLALVPIWQKLLVCHTQVQQDFLFGLGFAILGLEASAHADVAALTELALRSIERSA